MFTQQVRFRGTQRCLRGKCALGAPSSVYAASAPEQVLARRKVGAQYERKSAEEFEDGQVRQTGLTQKSQSPALKGAGQFGSYNLKRFERSYGSNCMAGTVQGQSGRSGASLALRLRAHLTGYAQGEKGVFETLTQGKGGVY